MATFEAQSESEMRSALGSASSGDTVLVSEGVTVDGTDRFTVPAGVRLASNLDTGGQGALIEFDGAVFDDDAPTLEANASVEGFRIYGPNDFPTDSEYSDASSDALNIAGDGARVEYCEVAGFGHRALRVTGDGVSIRHCFIHDVAGDGYGYGVGFEGGAQDGLIEYCRFEFNRHSIATNGACTWVARYNWVGERHDTGNHAFDCHEQGDYITVHNNSFLHNGDSAPGECLRIRGGNSSNITFEDNWVATTDDCGVPESDESCAVSDDAGAGDWAISGNHFDDSAPPTGVGVTQAETGIMSDDSGQGSNGDGDQGGDMATVPSDRPGSTNVEIGRAHV